MLDLRGLLFFASLLYEIERAYSNLQRGHGITSSVEDIRIIESYHLKAPYMSECCEAHIVYLEDGDISWTDLMQCTNSSSLNQQAKIQSRNTKGGIGLVTYATENIWNYTAYSFAVNEIYAEHNNYVMLHLDEGSSNNYDPIDSRWNKVKILEEALDPENGWARDYEWVVWVDADAIILDMDMKIEEVVASHPDAHLLVSAEHAGSSTLMNSGVVIVKNSPWTIDFLQKWWTFKTRTLYSDQEQFDLLYKAKYDELDLERKIAILPPDAINSDPPAMTQQKPYNQVLHLMGEHTMYRVKVFESGLRELCSHLTIKLGPSNIPVRRQLGISRENLLQWTLEEYGRESAQLLQEYRQRAVSGDNDRKQSVAMSNSVHHYAHALGSSHAEAQSLRLEVYHLLQTNLGHRRERNVEHVKTTGRVMEEWPEHLKCLAEAGQHLVRVGTVEERHRVSEEVLAVLEEMLSVCHREQRRAVLLMVAHMDFEIGVIFMSSGNYESGVNSFQRGVTRHRDLATDLGEHILVSPLAALASALCTVQRFDEASPLYLEAISIADRVLGSSHGSLAQHLLNFGISGVQSGKYDQARGHLERALGIMQTNGVLESDDMMVKCRQFLDMALKEEGATISLAAPVAEEPRLVHRRKRKKENGEL